MVGHDDDIGVSRSNEVTMTVEDEETGEGDQERQVKRGRKTSQMKLQISCLPNDALYCVFDKLLELVDFVRFAAACKELQLVARVYNSTKQRWMSKPKQLPMLMLPPNESDNNTNQRRLFYSVSERRIYNNINICLTNERFCGSSQGWLATAVESTVEWQEEKRYKLIHQITLRNPFGKSSEVIHLPPYMHCVPGNLVMLDRVNKWIPRVILSDNPALHPENYFVLFTLYRPVQNRIIRTNEICSPPLALIKGGQESWITINRDRLSPKFDDAIFYRNKFCLLPELWRHGAIATLDVDSIDNFSEPKIQYSDFHPTPRDIFDACPWERYLVESTNGDLLLVLRCLWCDKEAAFGVCKIVFNEEDKSSVQLVEVKCIGDDAIFLGQNQSRSVLASSVPGCKPNCIYYAIATETVPPDYLKSEMGIFDLGDRTRTRLTVSDSICNWNWKKMNKPFWVLPSLNI